MCIVLSTGQLETAFVMLFFEWEKSPPCSDRCEHTFYGGWPNGWNPSNPAAMQGQCVQRLTLNNTISPRRSGALPCPCLIPALCVITHRAVVTLLPLVLSAAHCAEMTGLSIVHKSGQRQPSRKASRDQQHAQSHLKAKGFNSGTGVIKGMLKNIWMNTHTHTLTSLWCCT